jgi:hypothetical protein
MPMPYAPQTSKTTLVQQAYDLDRSEISVETNILIVHRFERWEMITMHDIQTFRLTPANRSFHQPDPPLPIVTLYTAEMCKMMDKAKTEEKRS